MFYRPAAAVLAAICFLSGCSKQEKISGGPIAVLPFENLSSDSSLDWAGRGASTVLRFQLAGTNWVPLEAQSAEAQRAPYNLSGYLTERNGQIQLKAVVRNSNAQTVDTREATGTSQAGLLPLLNQLAKELTPQAKPFSTASEQAARELFLASGSSNPEAILNHLNASIAADPKFSTAYLAKIEYLERANRRDDAKSVIEDARKHASEFPPRDRAQLELAAGNLTADQQKRTQAMEELVKENPRDVPLAQNLAQSCVQARRFDCAIQALTKAIQIEPKNTALWNSLSYAQAFAGNFSAAQKSLDEYKKLAPQDANAWDSMAEIHVMMGRYADAEQEFLEAHKRNAAMLQGGHLYRAALAHALTKDIQGADALFQKYIDFRKQAKDPAIDLRTAIWQYQTGRTDKALATMEIASKPDQPLAGLALAEAAYFLLDQGKRDAAREKAVAAGKNAGSNPAGRTLIAVAQILSAPSVPAAEWKKRIDAVIANQPRAHDEVLGYALAFDGHYADSIPVWKSLYDSTTPELSNEPKSMLALAYSKTGKQQEVASLLKTGIFLPRNPEPGLDVLVFPRYRRLLQ